LTTFFALWAVAATAALFLITSYMQEMTTMTDLSPATQAIIDASNCAGSRCVQLHIADALRALAVRINGADAIRQDVLDIADELENQ
jgi:hypothetical protein